MAILRLAVLGSTGSIGQQTLDIVRALPQHFKVVALASGANAGLLGQQTREFQPEFVFSRDETFASRLAKDGKFLGMAEMAAHPDVDRVVVATSGMAGLTPTLAAVKAGKKVCLANKEAIVCAGELITAEAKRSGARILPVDSEHSAIWQCLEGERQKPAGIILTASGGPFRTFSPKALDNVTPEQALAHPSWRMGPKVTVDSATLMNKGLEIIEARWLFDIPIEKIRVLVHPQSIIHAMVEFADGAVKAQLSCPDMRLPIQYALSYPKRLANSGLPKIEWDSLARLDFEPPDYERFPCLRLATEAGLKGGTYPAVLCAADEELVSLFLAKRLKFGDIARNIEMILSRHRATAKPGLEEILAACAWARAEVKKLTTGEN
ncbi:MAG: 1-deoxy-D-xylulose-5-phosphate reductoisomerase [Chloroflexota bacterium]